MDQALPQGPGAHTEPYCAADAPAAALLPKQDYRLIVFHPPLPAVGQARCVQKLSYRNRFHQQCQASHLHGRKGQHHLPRAPRPYGAISRAVRQAPPEAHQHAGSQAMACSGNVSLYQGQATECASGNCTKSGIFRAHSGRAMGQRG